MIHNRYTLGGYDGERMVQSVEVFDPRVGSWMMGEQMKDSRGHFGAVVIGGKIYAIGGINNSEEILATVYKPLLLCMSHMYWMIGVEQNGGEWCLHLSFFSYVTRGGLGCRGSAPVVRYKGNFVHVLCLEMHINALFVSLGLL